MNFGNPEKPEIMAQLVQAVEGLGDACRHFGTPITGGNVSLYNETLGSGVHPSPVVGIVGILDHVDAPVGPCFTEPGSTLVLLGGLLPAAGEDLPSRFGSTQFARVVLGHNWGMPPALDKGYESAVHRAARQIVRRGIARSAHDVGDGGLAIALAECCFGAEPVGAKVDLRSDLPALHALFHEAPSRIVISVSPSDLGEIERIAADHGAESLVIGETAGTSLVVSYNGTDLFGSPVSRLQALWESAFEEQLEDQ